MFHVALQLKTLKTTMELGAIGTDNTATGAPQLSMSSYAQIMPPRVTQYITCDVTPIPGKTGYAWLRLSDAVHFAGHWLQDGLTMAPGWPDSVLP